MFKFLPFLACFFVLFSHAQTTFWTEGFENASTDGNGGTRTVSATFTTSANRHFTRTDGTTPAIGPGTAYVGKTGTFFWAGEDTDNGVLPPPANVGQQSITWSTSISGKTGSISFSGDFAIGRADQWDESPASGLKDHIIIEYRVDAGAFTQLMAFVPKTDVGLANAHPLGLETSLPTDTVVSGTTTVLSNTFQTVTASLGVLSGTTLTIRIRCHGATGGEEFALDNFRLMEGTLPVELLSFSGENAGESTVLHWITASESDNDYFQVERMAPSETEFTSIGVIDGAGNSTEMLEYRFEDEEAPIGRSFYRLSQADFNGQVSLSPVVEVLAQEQLQLTLGPNPTSKTVVISAPEGSSVILYGLTGQELIHQEVTKDPSSNILDISFIAKGIYHVKLVSPQNTSNTFLLRVE